MVLIIKMVKKPVHAKSDINNKNKAPGRKAGRPKQIEYALEKKFTLMLPRELHRALKIRSAEMEKPMTTMIIEAIKKSYNI